MEGGCICSKRHRSILANWPLPFTRCLDSSLGRVHPFDGGDPGSIPGGSNVYVGSPYCWQIIFEICAHFAFLFQPEQMFFPFTLHGSANLILFEKNYYVLMKTYKNFQIFCFLTMEVRSKMRKGYRRRNGNQTAL